MTLPVSTYRLQFRAGMDFDRATGLVPYWKALGIGALYASPVFTATAGSTHGYDVTDPTEIDPVLGGRAGLDRLAAALREAGIGLVLDIVPNHMAFSVETPWLRDILRHGAMSAYARYFDTDPAAARLRLPWLDRPFEEALQDGAFRVEDDADGAVLATDHLRIPLAATAALDEARETASIDAIRRLHAEQPWQLLHWRTETDAITHRRFFTVTGLIGTRVEDPQVFEDLHRLVFDLVETGAVTGLRVDHVDGLADPESYLARLRERVGPAVPIWVEKILVGAERLPDWGTEGTTGYETARDLNRLLTQPDGLATVRAAYTERTGRGDDFRDVLARAKAQIVTHDLAAELWTLHEMLTEIARRDPVGAELGPETLRQGLVACLTAFPRYRTYLSRGGPSEDDAQLIAAMEARAVATLQDDAAVRLIGRVLSGADPATATFRTRFQQVTGAAMAKSLEDTAFYREVRLLSLNEVGGEPDDAALTPAGFHECMAARRAGMPAGITLTSSHDTKRSEDARMRIAAITWHPRPFLDFHAACADLAPEDTRDNLVWYVAQSFLAIHGTEEVESRLVEHVMKALREAKRDTFWTAPDEDVEARARRLVERIVRAFPELPDGLLRTLETGERLGLIQTALKLCIPGIPDIYQGCEIASFRLTDPDNRAPVPFDLLARALDDPAALAGYDAAKFALTRRLLRLRHERPALFLEGAYEPLPASGEGFGLRRTFAGETLELRCAPAGGLAAPEDAVWSDPAGAVVITLA